MSNPVKGLWSLNVYPNFGGESFAHVYDENRAFVGTIRADRAREIVKMMNEKIERKEATQ